MKRFSSIAASLALAALCTNLLVAPLLAQGSGPKPPITDPNILGKPRQNTPAAVEGRGTSGTTGAAAPAASPSAIKTMADIAACVSKGELAYGVTIQTTNVRSAPST
jgi:hypothetical protein